MKMLFTAAAAALLTASPAFAITPITLDFEGAAGYVNAIGNFYNGGTDSLGQSGPNVGVSFTDAAVALSNDADFQYYSNAPSPLTVMFAFDSSAFMNVAQGFVDRFTFHYAATMATPDAVRLYSGLNGTGNLLASVSLAGNAQTGCTDTPYCHFDLIGVDFAGIARSVSFAGDAPNVVYDDLTILAVPEPSTYLMLSAGLLAVAGAARRRQSKQG